MSAPTPMPWHADGLAIESARHGNIGIVNLARASKADARLISAAPDLLAFAQQYASECGECGGTGYDIARSEFDGRPIRDAAGNLTRGKACQECADIRAAIAKATGAA